MSKSWETLSISCRFLKKKFDKWYLQNLKNSIVYWKELLEQRHLSKNTFYTFCCKKDDIFCHIYLKNTSKNAFAVRYLWICWLVALLTIDDQMLHKLNSVKPFASIPSFLNLFKILDLSEESPFSKENLFELFQPMIPLLSGVTCKKFNSTLAKPLKIGRVLDILLLWQYTTIMRKESFSLELKGFIFTLQDPLVSPHFTNHPGVRKTEQKTVKTFY